LRDTWKEFIYKKNPSLKNTPISTPVATNGITHGISIAGYMFANENDSIILSNLYWENYSLIFENGYGAKIEVFELFNDGGFNINSFKKR